MSHIIDRVKFDTLAILDYARCGTFWPLSSLLMITQEAAIKIAAQKGNRVQPIAAVIDCPHVLASRSKPRDLLIPTFLSLLLRTFVDERNPSKTTTTTSTN